MNGKIFAAQSYLFVVLSCYNVPVLSYTFVHLFTPIRLTLIKGALVFTNPGLITILMGHEKDILNGKICAAQSYLLSCYNGSFLSYTFVHLFTFLCISTNLYKFFLHLYVSKIHSFTLISVYENSTLLRKFSKRDEAISSVLGRH